MNLWSSVYLTVKIIELIMKSPILFLKLKTSHKNSERMEAPINCELTVETKQNLSLSQISDKRSISN